MDVQDNDITKVSKLSKGIDMTTESKYEGQKVNRNRLSILMRWILERTGNGIDRGQIVEGFYGLERRYRKWYTDPCFTPKKKCEYERRYRLVQPVVSRTLRRLEARGLVQSTRHGRYAKRIQLTAEGALIAKELTETYSEKV
jgi:DNA-binding transcriptional ArsR family regulator